MKKEANQKFLVVGLGILGVIVVFSLLFGLNNLTGSSISVQDYGVSDGLRPLDAGKIQIYLMLDQAEVKKILTTAGRAELADEIAKEVDFTEGLTTIYQNNPAVPFPAGELDAVRAAVSSEKNNFRNNQPCFYKIATNYQYEGNLKLVLISELKYESCSSRKDVLFAYARHTFYNYEIGGYICSEDDGKLFLVDQNTGDVTADVSNC